MVFDILSKKKFIFNLIHIIWITSLIGLILSCLISIDKNISIRYTIFYFFAMYISFYLAKYKNSILEFICKNIRIICIIFAVFTIMPLFFKQQYIDLMSLLFYEESYQRIKNFLVIKRFPGLGGYLGNNAFLLSTGLGLYVGSIIFEKRHRKLNLFIFLLLLISILLTGSRTALLLCTVSGVLSYIFKDRTNFIRVYKKIFQFVAIFLVSGILVFTIAPEAIVNILDRFQNGQESINNRFILYSYAIELFKNKPLFGFGINSFLGLTYTNPAMIENTYVHNIFLQLLAETGIVGAFFILIPYFFTWFSTLYLMRKQKKLEERKELFISFFIQNIFLIYFLSGNPLYDYNLLLIYFIFISIPIYYLLRRLQIFVSL